MSEGHPEGMPRELPDDLARLLMEREAEQFAGDTGIVVAESTDGVWGARVGQSVLVNVHPPTACAGRPCVIHTPSHHHMDSWELLWRDDTAVFERICPHGIGHPDSDQFEFWRETGREYKSVHGCDGCCRPPSNLLP